MSPRGLFTRRLRIRSLYRTRVSKVRRPASVQVSSAEQFEDRCLLSAVGVETIDLQVHAHDDDFHEMGTHGHEHHEDEHHETQIEGLDHGHAHDDGFFDGVGTFRNGHWILPAEPQELIDQDRAFYAALNAQAEAGEGGDPELAATALSDTFFLHSNPTATKTIYLDFDGNTTVGTSWNSSYLVTEIVSPAYDPDGNGASFTTNELQRIQRIWHRVAEDFSSFDVNVTTEDPGEAALVNTGGGDDEWGIRVVITVDNFANCGCGGFAYYNSFNWGYESAGATDTPVFVFNSSEVGVSGASSHEVGHAINLSHDGTTADNPVQPNATYYNGHGSGETGWGPIMGSGYYKNVTTWDAGEYVGANNNTSSSNRSINPDDLVVITTTNGFGYRQDDHGNNLSQASSVSYVGPNGSDPSLVDVAAYGIIEDRTDLDFIKFDTGAGLVSLTIDSYIGRVWVSNGDGTYTNSLESTFYNGTSWQNNQGTNLDVEAKLYDSSGTLIAASNPTGMSASFSNVNLAAGTYYISVDGTGFGDPTNPTSPTGYTDLGSIGQYYITGTVQTSGLKLSAVAVDAEKPEGNSGTTNFSFNITLSEAQSAPVTVDWSVLGSGGSPADAADFGGSLTSGQVTFEPGQTVLPITVQVSGDTVLETDETFLVSLSNPTAGEVFASAIGTILADDAQLQGRVWNDQNQSGAVEAGEVGLSGITVFLDSDQDGVLDAGEVSTVTNSSGDYSFDVSPGTYTIATSLGGNQTQTFPTRIDVTVEPDDYAAGTVLNTIQSGVTLSTVGPSATSSDVTSVNSSWTSTGSRAFGNQNGYGWYGTSFVLRADFDSPVSQVELDLISDDSSDYGYLEAYNSLNELLVQYATANLGTGVFETMTVRRAQSDIAYILAAGTSGQIAGLDNLRYSQTGQGSGVPINVTLAAEQSGGHDFGVFNSIPNDPPIAGNDSATTDEDQAVVVFVLANDTDPNGDSLSISAFTQTASGSVSNNGNGTLTYTPNLNFNGNDSFTYTISDGNGGTATATVTVTVDPVNDAPVATNDSGSTDVGTPVTISVLNNDSDVDGDALTVSEFTGAANGLVTNNGNGTMTYTPNTPFAGTDSFTYTITDGELTDTATVTITVTSPPGSISVTLKSLTTIENGPSTSFVISLGTIPTADVTIPISSSDTSEGTVNVSEVVFPAGTSDSITVVVTPIDDLLAGSLDGTQVYTIVTGLAISNDAAYSGLNADDVTVTNQDDDNPIAISVAASGELTSTGTRVGDYTLTTVNDGNSEKLTEVAIQVTGGKNPKLGSALQHQWSFVGLSNANEFTLIASRGANAEGDNFAFEYSTNGGSSWSPLVTVNSDNPANYGVQDLSLSGDVLVRVTDTDRSPVSGRNVPELTSLFVDYMVFQSLQEDFRPAVSVTTVDATANENPAAPGVIRIQREEVTSESLVVAYTVSGTATAGSDYSTLSGTATIPAGSLFVDVFINPLDDTVEEGNETVKLTLADRPGYQISGVDSATVTITDDDLLVFVATADILEQGTVTGDYTRTHSDNAVSQTILEQESGGKPSNRYTLLSHVWTFDVAGANSFTIDASTDATIDSFRFEYSTNGSTYVPFSTPIVITNNTAGPITVAVPPGLTGTIYVRVSDTDQSTGERVAEAIAVDYMAFSTGPAGAAPPAGGDGEGESSGGSESSSGAAAVKPSQKEQEDQLLPVRDPRNYRFLRQEPVHDDDAVSTASDPSREGSASDDFDFGLARVTSSNTDDDSDHQELDSFFGSDLLTDIL